MEKENEIMKCVWDTLTECRHPLWFENAQEYLNASKLSIAGILEETESQFDKLKGGCKLCLFGEMARQLRLFSVRAS